MLRDLRYALRQHVRRPAMAAAVILTFGPLLPPASSS